MNDTTGVKTVIMAEKANAAKDIADALELEDLKRLQGSGFYSGRINSFNFVITYSNGHCLRLLEPKEIDNKYERWTIENLPIPFTARKLKAIESKKTLLKAIGKEVATADFIINAGDAGREGELIQRWIIKEYAPSKKYNKIYRMWLSSLTKTAIKEAFDNYIKDNETFQNLYKSGEARAVMDKFLGFNYSRLISLARTEGLTVNYGRCKSPLVNAIIERNNEVNNFVKRVFFNIEGLFNTSRGDGIKATLISVSENETKKIEFDEKKLADNKCIEIKNKLKNTNPVVSGISSKKSKQYAPNPFDILTMQKEMSKRYGFEADKTLELCQALYDKHKILSYPRTDSRYLTSDLKRGINDNLKALSFGKFKGLVKSVEGNIIPAKYFNDKKVADHHGLIPVIPEGGIEAKYKNLSADEQKAFDLIAYNFIALFATEYVYETTNIIISAAGYKFGATGKTVLEKGWKNIYDEYKEKSKQDEEQIKLPPYIKQGEQLKTSDILPKECETKPKQNFTTASLLDFMKIHNIGTGATRDGIIKELTQVKGLNLEPSVQKENKYFIATDFGRQQNKVIPKKLRDISFLSDKENQLKAIEEGRLSIEDFYEKMYSDFEKDYSEIMNSSEIITKGKNQTAKESNLKCPLCGEPLLDRGTFYGCTSYRKDDPNSCSFSLPKKLAGRTIKENVYKELLERGKTSKKVKGFKSKKGSTFEAYLVLENENGKPKIGFSFD